MNYKVILWVILSLLMNACSQESDNVEELSIIQGQIMDASSRTYLDNGKIIWKAGDAISVFLKTGFHQCHDLSAGDGTSSATFSYRSTIEENTEKLDCHYAVYPFSNNYVLNNDNTISVDLSSWATQNYTENTFEDDKAFMTGKSTSITFPFYNAQSLARVKLSSVVPGSFSISSVSFTSPSAALNGNAVIDMTQEKPILVLEDTNVEACRTNTLVCASNIILTDEPTEFYVLMPSGTYSDLTLTVKGFNEMDGSALSWSKTYNYDITFQRSVIETFNHKFEAVDFSGEIKPD